MTISLPIELWGLILLNNSIEESVKFIQQCAFLSLFSNEELYYLKSNFIHNSILSSKLNKEIYLIYKNIDSINSNKQYIHYFSTIYNLKIELKLTDLIISVFLCEHLSKKIKENFKKTKFLNITNKINKMECYPLNLKLKDKLLIKCI